MNTLSDLLLSTDMILPAKKPGLTLANRWRISDGGIIFLGVLFFLTLGWISPPSGWESSTLQSLASGPDDWNRYARHALEIHRNGLLMPGAPCPYDGPGGFLYAYFLAAYAAGGWNNSGDLYLLQSALLGLSWGLWTCASRTFFRSPWLWGLFSVSFAVVFFLDVYRHYVFRLLSENLFLPLQAVWFYSWIQGSNATDQGKIERYIWPSISSIAVSWMALVRPQLILFPWLFLVGSIGFYRYQGEVNKSVFWIFSVFITATEMFLCFRNFWVCGVPSCLPEEGMSYALSQGWSQSGRFFQKLAFIMGWLPALAPEYHIRPHWLLAWAGILGGGAWNVLKRRVSLPYFGMGLLFILYYGATLFWVELPSYGFRYILPLMPLLWIYLFIVLQSWVCPSQVIHR